MHLFPLALYSTRYYASRIFSQTPVSLHHATSFWFFFFFPLTRIIYYTHFHIRHKTYMCDSMHMHILLLIKCIPKSNTMKVSPKISKKKKKTCVCFKPSSSFKSTHTCPPKNVWCHSRKTFHPALLKKT